MNDELSPRIALAGSVSSSLRILQVLYRHSANIVGVLGLDKKLSHRVSGFRDLGDFCSGKGIPFESFINLNDYKPVKRILGWHPDILFVVGLSQIVRKDVLEAPSLGVVGFHPTILPEGRGRAPLAWLTYHCRDGAATFFVISDGMDDGPILFQKRFEVGPDDHAEDVERNLMAAIDEGMNEWLPSLLQGEWQPKDQDNSKASYTGIRMPIDGQIDWGSPADRTYAVIRASSRPHPGAFTFLDGKKLRIWRASRATNSNTAGEAGRVLALDTTNRVLVQAGDAQLWLEEYNWADDEGGPVELKVGQLLGYRVQAELQILGIRLAQLEKMLKEIPNG